MPHEWGPMPRFSHRSSAQVYGFTSWCLWWYNRRLMPLKILRCQDTYGLVDWVTRAWLLIKVALYYYPYDKIGTHYRLLYQWVFKDLSRCSKKNKCDIDRWHVTSTKQENTKYCLYQLGRTILWTTIINCVTTRSMIDDRWRLRSGKIVYRAREWYLPVIRCRGRGLHLYIVVWCYWFKTGWPWNCCLVMILCVWRTMQSICPLRCTTDVEVMHYNMLMQVLWRRGWRHCTASHKGPGYN